MSLKKYVACSLISSFFACVGGIYFATKQYEKMESDKRCVFILESVLNATALQECGRNSLVRNRIRELTDSAINQAEIVISEQGINQKTTRTLQSLRDYCLEYNVKTTENLSDVFKNLPPTPPCKNPENP